MGEAEQANVKQDSSVMANVTIIIELNLHNINGAFFLAQEMLEYGKHRYNMLLCFITIPRVQVACCIFFIILHAYRNHFYLDSFAI